MQHNPTGAEADNFPGMTGAFHGLWTASQGIGDRIGNVTAAETTHLTAG
jgi:hypothetical protein